MTEYVMDYAALIRDIPDYPKPGIVFKDLTGIWLDPKAHKSAAVEIAAHYRDSGVTKVASAEARGVSIGSLVAAELGAGFVPVRKPGKLPHMCISESYELEYGSDTLEMHCDAIVLGDVVLLVDDLLATGGTLAAARSMVLRLGGKVCGVGAIVSLDFLEPQKKLDLPIFALVRY
jgi:adenine phosphoribosyltransferase